jgi:hypothetical protein
MSRAILHAGGDRVWEPENSRVALILQRGDTIAIHKGACE